MKLLQLKLENFRQHRDTNLQFADGMTAIVGANGSGKTTILEAITFALYGKQREGLETVKFYWSDGKKYSVTLRFAFDGRTYEAYRSHSEAYLKDVTNVPETTRAMGKDEVKRACTHLLGLNYDQFVNSFCAEQKKIEFMKFKTGGDLQEEIGRMLGFDRLRLAEIEARDRRKGLISEISGRREVLKMAAQLEVEQAQAQRALVDAETNLKASQVSRAETARQLPEAKQALEKANTYHEATSEMGMLQGVAEGLKAAAAQSEKAYTDAKRDSEEKTGLEAGEKEFRELDKERIRCEELKQSEVEREKLADQRKRIGEEIVTLDLKLNGLAKPDVAKSERAVLEATIAEQKARKMQSDLEAGWRKSQSDAQSAWKHAVATFEHVNSDLQKARAMIAQGVCPECGQKISEATKAGIFRRETECDTAKAKADALAKTFAALNDKPNNLAEAETNLAKAVASLSQVQEARLQAFRDADAVKSLADQRAERERQGKEIEAGLKLLPSNYDAERHQALLKQLIELVPSHERYLALADADRRITEASIAKEKSERELNAAKQRYAELKEKRSLTGFANVEEANFAKANHDRLSSDLRVFDLTIENSERERRQAETRLAETKQRIAERGEQEQAVKELESKELLHGVVAVEMKGLREELNKSIRPDLIARASENLSLLTSNRYPILDLDKNFEPVLIDEGVEKKVISGGEQDVVALALRLALSERIQELNGRPMSLLILDEVFGSLDADRRQNVLERLINLKGRFNQIFVISHIEEINQIADQCIYLSRDELSRATIVADAVPEQIPLEF